MPLLLGLAVEFRPKESRSRLQNLIRTFQLLVLTLKLFDPGLLFGRHTRALTGVDLSPPNPIPERLMINPELA